MKNRKINTIPNGKFVILLIVLAIIVITVISIALIPNPVGFAVHIITAYLLFSIKYLLSLKYLNYVYMSDNGTKHENTNIPWEKLCITMYCPGTTFANRSWNYYLYFDDKYLSEDEIKSKANKKKGFYIVATKKRFNYILPMYNKKIKILNEAPVNKKFLNQVISHNEKK